MMESSERDRVLKQCLELLWRLDKAAIFTPDSLTVELEEFVRRGDIVEAMKSLGIPHWEGEPKGHGSWSPTEELADDEEPDVDLSTLEIPRPKL